MSNNKTQPNQYDLKEYLNNLSPQRLEEANLLIDLMQKTSNELPMLWGPSIIGFGAQHYKYESGHEGDMPLLSFSPRKAAITIYFAEGFDRYNDLLSMLGKYKTSRSCLYITKLQDIDLNVLSKMINESYKSQKEPLSKPTNVEEYIEQIPKAARDKFDELRTLTKSILPNAEEVFSYGIIGYKINDKRPKVYISGWKDHLAIYPVPKDDKLQEQLIPHIKGKGTLWFMLDEDLPKGLIEKIIKSLTE